MWVHLCGKDKLEVRYSNESEEGKVIERRIFKYAAENTNVKFGLNFTDVLFGGLNCEENLVTNRGMFLGENLGHNVW
jgi:hypothetical protein